MKICVISDTHEKHQDLTEQILSGKPDVIIHCGDAANHKSPAFNQHPMMEFLRWYEGLDIDHKIFVPGNHDTSIQHGFIHPTQFKTIDFLINETIEISRPNNGQPDVRIFGSPYTPTFGTGWAYNKARNKLDRIWKQIIPDNIDIVVTHGPPKGILDLTESIEMRRYEQVGCKSLLNRIRDVNPEYSLFGHIHDESNVFNYGLKMIDGVRTKFINASNCNLQYKCVNPPIFIEI